MRSAFFTDPRLLRLWLFVLIAASVVLIGGATVALSATLCIGVALLGCLFFKPLSQGQNLLSLTCAALALITLLQACPLPLPWLELLSHQAAQFHSTTAQAFGLPSPHWRPLSLSPLETRSEAAKWASFSILSSLSYFLGKQGALQHLLKFLGMLSTALVLCFWFHKLSGAEKLFGFYEPRGVTALSPLVNLNNLAGYLNVGTLAWVGLAFSKRASTPRALGVLLAFLGAATTLQTGSRAGALSLGLGLILMAILGSSSLMNRGRQKTQPTRLALISPRLLPLMLTLVMASVLASSLGRGLQMELLNTDIEKFFDSIALGKAIGDFPVLGTGKGATSTISPYYLERNDLIYQFIESFPLSWCLEWGPLVGILVFIIFVYLLVPTRLELNGSRMALSLWLAIACLIFQNLFDLAFEIYAPTALLIVSISFLLGRKSGLLGSSRLESFLTQYKLGPLLMLSVSALIGISCLIGPPQLSRVKEGLFERYLSLAEEKSQTDSAQTLLYDISQAAVSYPAERRFLILAALTQNKLKGPGATPELRYISEALRRSPDFAQAHFLAGHFLLSAGLEQQGFLELRKSYLSNPKLSHRIARYVQQLSPSWHSLQPLIPKGKAGASLANTLALTVPNTHLDLKLKLLQQAHELDPQNSTYQLSYALLNAQTTSSFLQKCRSSPCDLRTADALARLQATNHTMETRLKNDRSCGASLFRARLAADESDYARALSLTKNGCSYCPSIRQCLQERLHFAERLANEKERQQAESEYLDFMCQNSNRCVSGESYIAHLAARRRAWLSASVHQTRAATIANEGMIWAKAAYYAAKAGRSVTASLAISNAKRLGADVEAAEKALKQSIKENEYKSFQ